MAGGFIRMCGISISPSMKSAEYILLPVTVQLIEPFPPDIQRANHDRPLQCHYFLTTTAISVMDI